MVAVSLCPTCKGTGTALAAQTGEPVAIRYTLQANNGAVLYEFHSDIHRPTPFVAGYSITAKEMLYAHPPVARPLPDVRAFVESLELPWLSPEFSVKDLAVQAIEAWVKR